MKRCSFLLLAITLLVLSSGCQEEKELQCFPISITTKSPGAGGVQSIISDYIYSDETGNLDRINSSNYQSSYFFWDENGRVTKIQRKNVQTLLKNESVAGYDGDVLKRMDEYRMKLDVASHEDLDTTMIGYSLFEYSGGKVSTENVYALNEESQQMEFDSYYEYSYDDMGNISTMVRMEESGTDTLEAYSYTYDGENHIFKSLNLPFERESYINNKLKTTNLLTGDVYNHKMIYTITRYPQQIETRLEGASFLEEILTAEYSCK